MLHRQNSPDANVSICITIMVGGNWDNEGLDLCVCGSFCGAYCL